MQRLILKRCVSTTEETFGVMMFNGSPVCWTLEDEKRTEKVYGETRIPAGVYNITLRREGTHHTKYAQKFGGLHKGMLWIRDVPNFEYILIHIGNFDEDTEGCILVGSAARLMPEKKLEQSTEAYLKLYQMVCDFASVGALEIEVSDEG